MVSDTYVYLYSNPHSEGIGAAKGHDSVQQSSPHLAVSARYARYEGYDTIYFIFQGFKSYG